MKMQWRSDWFLWACLLKDVKCSCLVTRFLTGLLWATAVERAPELFGSQGGPLSLESSCRFSTSCGHPDEMQSSLYLLTVFPELLFFLSDLGVFYGRTGIGH